MKTHLAVDLGASGGRHILGSLDRGLIRLEEVYRFENKTVEKSEQLCWDSDVIFSHVLAGINACKERNIVPDTMGIDTWGVDFALLDEDDKLLGNLVSYRDDRTKGLSTAFDEKMPYQELYRRTGSARQDLNTLYQLIAAFRDNADFHERARSMLFLPCYLSFLLTGEKRNEYTIASTSALLNAHTRTWDEEVVKAASLPMRLFAEQPVMPVSSLGDYLGTEVVLPPAHDTASAFIAVPAKDENAVYISSGTWSLLGVETDKPLCNPESARAGFTNEGCYGNKLRCLRNIMGLWLLQEIRRELQNKYDYAEMAEMATKSSYGGHIDANDRYFLAPASMTEAVRENLKTRGFPPPQSLEDVLRAVIMGLAVCYRDSIRELETLVGKRFTSINIVGGGSKNHVLNQWTSDLTGLPVYAGPVEATALGNIVSQMLYSGELSDIQQARDVIRKSYAIGGYESGKPCAQNGGN